MVRRALARARLGPCALVRLGYTRRGHSVEGRIALLRSLGARHRAFGSRLARRFAVRIGELAIARGILLVLRTLLPGRFTLGGAVPLVGGITVGARARGGVAGVDGFLFGSLCLGEVRVSSEAHGPSLAWIAPCG